jgi:16S rRNA (adenine(1408)-N(1))-methyltransferase
VTVNYPWGSLLRAVALPDPALLERIARVMKPGAALDILVNITPLRDAALADRLALSGAALLGGEAGFRAAYAAAGLGLRTVAPFSASAPSTRWGKQLAHSGREILQVRARKLL